MSLKHYIRFYYPGVMFAETESQQIPRRSAPPTIPPSCYGYSFFDREEVVSEDGEMLRGELKNQSGTHYFGEVFSLGEIKRKFPSKKILISNMEGNGYEHMVKTRCGNFQVFDRDKDSIVGNK